MNLEILCVALRASWSAETSSASDWSIFLKEKGQCAVTALVVQDLFGGELVRAVNEGESHYWNVLPDGTEVDLTRSQFVTWAPQGVGPGDRSYVLSFPATEKRYKLLRERVRQAVAWD